METSKEDFNEFVTMVKFFIQKYGLISWESVPIHRKLEDDTIAQLITDTVERIASFSLNTEWSDTESYSTMEEVALHEVYELLLWKLRVLVPDHLAEQATEEAHKIIQTLMNAR